jgi:hypothetical protein
MADTFKEFLNLTQPEIGASDNAWSDKLNADRDILDSFGNAGDA